MSFPKNSIDKLMRRFSEISSNSNNFKNVNLFKYPVEIMNCSNRKISSKTDIDSFQSKSNYIKNLNNNNNTNDSLKSDDLSLKQQIDTISKITQSPVEKTRVSFIFIF